MTFIKWFMLAAGAIAFLAVTPCSTAQAAVTFAKSWSTYGPSGTNVLNNPQGVAVNTAGQVYVVDNGNDRVVRFDSNGGYQTAFGSPGPGQNGTFANPVGVAVNSAGQVYVVDYANTIAQRFDGNGVFQTWFPLSLNPTWVAISPAGQIYVATSYTSVLDWFDSGENFLNFIGSAGTAVGQFNNPNGVAVNASGQLYVADYGNNRIERFASNGGSPFAFGSAGSGVGQLNHPLGVAVSATGQIYVSDSGNNRVQRFDGSGNFQASFGSSAVAGQLSGPSGIATSPTGEIYLIDSGHNRVEKWFDPSEWLSGSPHFDSADIGTGQLMGTIVTLDATHGLLVNGLLNIHAGGTLNQTVAASFGSMTNSGSYTLNSATLTLTSGSLTNNASASIYSGIVGGNTVNNYGATLNASGADFTGNLLNNGTLTPLGSLVISGSLTNNGLVVVNSGGAISTDASGTFTNAASGILRGDGAVTMTLTNSGGLIHANGTSGLTFSSFAGNYSGGELRVADGDSLTLYGAVSATVFNSALMALKGPNSVLSGDTIVNNGSLQGQGRISNSIVNFGTIRADGGALVVAGAPINNASTGSIQSAAGTSIVVTQGLALNSGLIALTGGSFDNGGHTLTNYYSASILGNGTFSTGGLSNYSTITFSDGNSSIFGPVANSGTISTYGTSATNISFYGAVVNSASSAGAGGIPAGRIKINGNTVRWLGGLTNNGVYISDPADNYFSGLAIGASGLLQGGVGDRFFVTSPFTSAGQINLGGTSQMVVNNGTGLLTQTAGQLEMGAGATLAAGTVQIDGGKFLADGSAATITSSLLYSSSSSSTYQGVLAGPGNTLTVNNPSALLVLSGTANSYTGGTFVTAGELIVTSAGGILDRTNLIVGGNASAFHAAPVPAFAAPQVTSVPEPGTLAFLAFGLWFATTYRRFWRRG